LEETEGDELGNESAGEEQVEQIKQLLTMVIKTGNKKCKQGLVFIHLCPKKIN